MKRKLISFDWAIKRILRDKANFEILEGFLSELLFEDITILELLESESNQDTGENKSNRLDIKVKNQKDEMILIELQYSTEFDYLQRLIYATSKAIVEHMKKGAKYAEITKIISISILYFNFGDGDDYIYKGTTSFIGMHNNTPLQLSENQKALYKTEKIEKIYPEYYLIKVSNFNDKTKNNIKNALDEWIYFLRTEEISEHPQAKGLLKAKEELDYLKMNEKERLQYDQNETDRRNEASMYESTYVLGEIKGRKEGHEEGRIEGLIEGEKKGHKEGEKKGHKEGQEEGRMEEKKEIAKKLFAEGLALETIKKLTDLTDEELASILKAK